MEYPADDILYTFEVRYQEMLEESDIPDKAIHKFMFYNGIIDEVKRDAEADPILQHILLARLNSVRTRIRLDIYSEALASH